MLSLSLAENNISNLFLFHVNTLIEFWFLIIFFHASDKKYGKKFPLDIVLSIGVIMIMVNTLFIQKLDTFNSYSATLVNIALLISSFRFFFNTMDAEITDELKTLKVVVSCLLLVFGTSLIVLLFSNAMLDISTTYQLYIWAFRGILILVTKVIIGFLFANLLYLSRNKLMSHE